MPSIHLRSLVIFIALFVMEHHCSSYSSIDYIFEGIFLLELWLFSPSVGWRCYFPSHKTPLVSALISVINTICHILLYIVARICLNYLLFSKRCILCVPCYNIYGVCLLRESARSLLLTSLSSLLLLYCVWRCRTES